MDKSSTYHRAIVTGGARGIGRAIVDRLLADGHQVLSCGRSKQPEDWPGAAHWHQADVSDPAQVQTLIAVATEKMGAAPNLLVNNAGVQVEKTIADSSDDDWDSVVGVNCRGVFNMCRAVLPSMQEHGGNIINIGSISGVVADPSMGLYNASKAFVHGLTRSIAVDHGPQVRCNAIKPGWIMTAMAEEGFALADNPAAAMSDALARHPVGRFGQPSDIANAVAWLADPQSAYLNGECITVDGGMTAASPLQPGLF